MGLWVGAPLLAAGLLLVSWAVWPPPAPLESIPLGPLDQLLPAHPAGSATTGPNLSLFLRAPRVLRKGAQTQVTALLAPEGDSTETASLPPGFNLVAVAWIQTSDLALDPNGEILEPLTAGERASYTWRAAPLRTGDLEATLFVRLELVPQQGGEVSSRTILARALPMRATSPLGLTQTTAVALGIAALLVGGVLVVGAWLGRRPTHEAAS
ncbi:MAG: hypothetical protein NTY23_08760 [Chloroflexi bacterium]|nr:hypothetical protein [Chloroflexota bacterium]